MSGRKVPQAAALEKLTKLFQKKSFAEATALSLSLTNRFPRHAFGWKVLGCIYQAQERYPESLEASAQAVRLSPEDAATHNNLGITLVSLTRFNEAESCFRRALRIEPDYVKAIGNLGKMYWQQGKLQEAQVCWKKVLELDPAQPDAHVGMGNTLELQNKLPQATASYKNALVADSSRHGIYSDMLFCMSLDIQVDAHQLHAEHLAFGEQFEAPLRPTWSDHPNKRDPKRCLQVGFVSGDLCDHALASFLLPVLEFLSNDSGLCLHAYYNHSLNDEVTQCLRAFLPNWHAVLHLTDVELAESIRADGIDILIDLSGHTARNRLLTFARKPAPIQASWMGYPGTTGLQAMDYFICDPFWVPAEFAWQFTEKLAYLPSNGLFFSRAPAWEIRQAPCLSQGYPTFGSFNRLNKLNASTIVLWSMLLKRLPDARLIIGSTPPESHASLLQSFSVQGVYPHRLSFAPRTSMREYLELHHQVDICLDTFPYAGGTTTCHAFTMGVPTLTLAGETLPSRTGAGLMEQLGLTSFVAKGIEDFIEKGTYWGIHHRELNNVRTSMRSRFDAAPIGQPQLIASHLQSTLRTMWQRWCAGLPTESFEVNHSNAQK